MSLPQLHYTSAAAGDGESAARYTAVTPAIPGPVRAEAAPLLAYEAPAGTPERLTDARLRALPVAFGFAALSDGSHLLSRAVATASGGFHAHGVHLPAGTPVPGRVLPVAAWGATGWLSTTPDRAHADPLTLLSGTQGPSHGLTREGLGDFAVSRSPWLAAVLSDLRRVSEDPSAPPVVLVERQSADVARWVALATAVLPREHAERLTFTTYTRQPGHTTHQVIGVLPEDAPDARDPRFRVHASSGPRPAGVVEDAWAGTAARIWRSRAPELFREAAELPGEPFAAGPLAVTALGAGIALGSDERAAAADWAAVRPYALDEKRTRQLTDALTAPADDRTAGECAAALRLLTALDGRCPASVTAPLAALLVTEAVRGGDVGLEPPARSAFDEPAGERALAALVDELGDDLLAELGPGVDRGVARTVQLLRIVRLLGVDCGELLPDVVHRLARALLDDPEAGACPALLDLLDEQFDVRTALLGELDRLAPDDPASAEKLLIRVTLPFTGTQALPHLRMCAEAPGAKARGADRVGILHTVLRAAGMSPFAEPLVLRTAVGLVWGEDTPTAGEARSLLTETTSDAHRTAGTWAHLVDAALAAPLGDEDAPELAHDLLRGFPQEIAARVRACLMLLDFARDLRAGTAEPGWADRARELRSRAEPVEPLVLEQAYGALAERLLAPDRPDAELYAFVHSGDEDLIAAYGRAARRDEVRALLTADPSYVADCFTVWNAHPHAGAAWTRTRTALLDEVLRPAVRSLAADGLTAVEQAVEREGNSRTLDAFRAWNRPSRSLGRLGKRIAGRVRRG
ncbi:GTPase-associated protein 1-related protein [Streptomyces sp. NBC_00059]|uniref:GTPase-associated protein 1-related protein n=1 Tax=Streptomyces sp. NBC_00059 TaxID=2975635 RepID=UPI00224E0086|nr:GTPase-associated protein 1-related protein [Streptomyces sp. NBC_00059]MCX5417400.1 GTPase-associated protein 1-related protein [Streptomyces sp. NBC_00059]